MARFSRVAFAFMSLWLPNGRWCALVAASRAAFRAARHRPRFNSHGCRVSVASIKEVIRIICLARFQPCKHGFSPGAPACSQSVLQEQ